MNKSLLIHRMEFLSPDDARREIERIGAHPEGAGIMAHKAILRPVKIHHLTPYQANVLKQEMLSLGADVAIAAGCVDCSVKETDAIVLGTLAHYERLAEKLSRQPPSLCELGHRILKVAQAPRSSREFTWRLRDRTLTLGKHASIMGVVNVTPDSFSDGGKFLDPEAATRHALALADEGADILDIGGESSRPGSEPVSADEEKRRVLPVLEALRGKTELPISIDTYKATVAEAAIECGAIIVNDITALRGDAQMASLCAEAKVGLVIMHMQGAPKTMQQNPTYRDVVKEISEFFTGRMNVAEAAGISSEAIVLDPGIGFGKLLEHNLALMRAIPTFLEHHRRPLLLGISQKRFIGELTGAPVGERLPGTIATAVVCAMRGASIIRVHDVAACRAALAVADAFRS